MRKLFRGMEKEENKNNIEIEIAFFRSELSSRSLLFSLPSCIQFFQQQKNDEGKIRNRFVIFMHKFGREAKPREKCIHSETYKRKTIVLI